MEMEKFAQVFESERGKEILHKLIDKMKVVDVDETFLHICKPYFPEDELLDIYHTATCLQDTATLITNDKHFDKINTDTIIEVWSISKTIEELEI
jgi:spermidine synthase